MSDALTWQNEIILSRRLGFVRLAIRHGADLVPTFVFGEKWLHKCVRVGRHACSSIELT